MEDSMNALQSYLNLIKKRGIRYSLLNNNNDFIHLIIMHDDARANYIGGLVRRIKCTEEGISNLLEEVENYVESIVK